jgi:hypothetical protein
VFERDPRRGRHRFGRQGLVNSRGIDARQGFHHHGQAVYSTIANDPRDNPESLQLDVAPKKTHDTDSIDAERARILNRVQERPFRILQPVFSINGRASVEAQESRHPSNQLFAVSLYDAIGRHHAISSGFDYLFQDLAWIFQAIDRPEGPGMVQRYNKGFVFKRESVHRYGFLP